MIAKLIQRLARNAANDPDKVIPQEDIDLMQRLAEGDESARHDAIRAYRRNLLKPGAKSNPHMQYMSEVDTPVFDQLRRNFLAKKLTKRA